MAELKKKAKYKLGNVVILKSGGPLMVITEINEHDFSDIPIEYLCQWFVGGEVYRSWLNEHTIIKVG